MTILPVYNLDQLRRAFPITGRLTYLNHAAIAPVPLPTRQIMDAANERLMLDPPSFYADTPGDPLANVFGAFAAEVARHINAAHLHEIVSMPSTSAGLNSVAQAFPWKPGDNVVFCEVEFPSNAYSWMALERARGVECRMAPAVDGGAALEAFEPLVDDRTRVIAVSAVQFLSGHRADLAAFGAFCRARGILFVVDAIQAAGHMPIDVQALQIDVLASGGQKSLMGPPGQGFLYVREQAAEQMIPAFVGPSATRDWEHWLKYDLTPLHGAQRFLLGTTSLVGMIGLAESMRFLRGLGLDHIDAWTRHLSQVAIEDLTARGWRVITPSDPARLGPIVTFEAGDPDDLDSANAQADAMMDTLKTSHIRVTKHWDARKMPHVRIATHCYNTEDEVRRVGAVLEGYRS